MSETQLVFAETSPYDSAEAIIEQDDQVAYFYVRAFENERIEVRDCWVRNLVEAPEELDRDRVNGGLAPVMPARFCRERSPGRPLDEKSLRVVWFEPGDGAALLEDEQVIAVILPAGIPLDGKRRASGYQIHGLSRDCQVPNRVCFPLLPDSKLIERVQKADRFWKSWQSEQSPWQVYEPKLIGAVEENLGEIHKLYSIDGGQWPPRVVAHCRSQGLEIFVTIGMSLTPQPQVESLLEQPRSLQRIELAMALPEGTPQVRLDKYLRFLSGQAALPWKKLVFLAHGHTIACDVFQQDPDVPDYSSVLLYGQQHLDKESVRIEMPLIEGDPVNLLWMVPLYENERKYLAQTGNFTQVASVLSGNDVPTIESRRIFV